MPELTDQEKIERRRQKRQQKILSSAGDRLSRITGTAYRNTSTDNVRSRKQQPTSAPGTYISRSHDDDPSEALGAPPPLDPFDMFSSMASRRGFSINPALLASMTGENINNNNTSSAAMDPTIKYWNLIHLLSMLILGFYAVYMEWAAVGMTRMAQLLQATSNDIYGLSHSGPLFWYFATIELCLQSARMFYQQGTMASNSTLGALATQLPPPLNNIITVFLRYRLIWSCLVQDCCILVFIIGFAQVISAFFV
ncbi:uncharacterized protein BX664DRAFT_263269 [Halteromyces radiatus]|uniref:uncharacterized protein n=1 Tax=Halteromyces radiatus TaxID=101107 RepID=UPI00221E5CE8|nr:uncharacterized protein BX664DRAFT_263269 [Halteromyces radiatus]KAI8089259.1 hypothetical protein BX664DRAFT_263269 [Halteromyces radiatus]